MTHAWHARQAFFLIQKVHPNANLAQKVLMLAAMCSLEIVFASSVHLARFLPRKVQTDA
jgi:hypothetical protein